MLSSAFFGHKPSKFQINPIVKSFIVSETFFWAGQNLMSPIFAIFVAQGLSDGSLEAAGTAVTVYMIARILAELISGKLLKDTKDSAKFWYSIIGVVVVGLGYVGMAFVSYVVWVYALQFMIGIGFGIASPAKYSLFSRHLDKGKESSEWSIYDAAIYAGMACTAMLGGFIANEYGFDLLLITSGIVIILGCIPYALFVFDKD
ncbi:MFS transporter [candidate division WWE3 bacterium]|uniref:MFS transporter n=1 Tax=candidate division WWE3 bacterium TaxID=2053526 RepID=A0A955RQQ8_UNCKA|nr:MFS transporter [candidate division WWE3 bacterium]